MSEDPKSPAAPIAYARWVRERGGSAAGRWHRPAVWPIAPDAPVATMCGREVVMDSTANVGGIPQPPCVDCCAV